MNIFTGKLNPNTSITPGRVSTSDSCSTNPPLSTLPSVQSLGYEVINTPVKSSVSRKLSVPSSNKSEIVKKDDKNDPKSTSQCSRSNQSSSNLYPVLPLDHQRWLRNQKHKEFPIDQEDEKNTGTVKYKLMSMWNNVKYGWGVTLKATFNSDSPIWFLGTIYHHNLLDSLSQSRSGFNSAPDASQVAKNKEVALNHFQQDYFSRIWFTYRKNFPRIDGSSLTTDCGWGCMLRSGQMMLAQALITHYLGRSWRFCGSQTNKNDMIHRMIIKWFLDEPSSPFSLHQLVKIGTVMGKKPGDWFGPATAAHILTQALTEAFVENPILENMCAYVAQDCTVYVDDIVKICTESTSSRRKSSIIKRESRKRTSSVVSAPGSVLRNVTKKADSMTFDHLEDLSAALDAKVSRSRSHLAQRAVSTFNLYDGTNTSSTTTSGYASVTSDHESGAGNNSGETGKWRGVVIFIPVRLGGEKFNPVYTECVKSLFGHPSTLGIIGGRPRHSVFFVGVQEDKLIYLDPHLCQDTVDTGESNFPISSFHCNDPRKMSISKMDPSCTLAFYCRTRQEFIDLTLSVKDFVVPGQRHTDYPIFVFAEGSSPNHEEFEARHERMVRLPQQRHQDQDDHEQLTDDFVLIS